jgi:hypothetical protein
MQADHQVGSDVPAWFLDTDYNDLSFHVSQAFSPRTSAWDRGSRVRGTAGVRTPLPTLGRAQGRRSVSS